MELIKTKISIDPGLGFGKSIEDSQKLFENLEYFSFGFPLVVGYSKKKFAQNLKMTDEELYDHCIKIWRFFGQATHSFLVLHLS